MMGCVFSLSQKNTEKTLGSAKEVENLNLEFKMALTQFRYS